MTERRSVSVESLAAAILEPGIGLCWHDQGHQQKIAAAILAALPAEPTEPAGALDVQRLHQAISDGLFLIAGSDGDMSAQDWREADTRDVITRARLAPSEPRADSEGLDARARLMEGWAVGPELRPGDRWLSLSVALAILRGTHPALRREQPAAEGEREVEG